MPRKKSRPAVRSNPRKLLSVAEVAEQFAVSVSTIRRLVSGGELHPHRIGGQLRFDPAEVARYLSATI